MTYSPSNIMKSITIQNLCKPMDKSTSEGTIQGFILNLIAKSDKCPIKKVNNQDCYLFLLNYNLFRNY